MTFYQFLQTWTGRWCLFFVSFVVLALLGMLGYHESREVGKGIFLGGLAAEGAALTALLSALVEL